MIVHLFRFQISISIVKFYLYFDWRLHRDWQLLCRADLPGAGGDCSQVLRGDQQSLPTPGQVRSDHQPPASLSSQAAAAQKYEVAFTVLGVISLIFLLLTFYVYISLPDLYNLHGKIVLSNVVSAFLVTLYLIIVFNIIPSQSIFCLVLGYLVKASCPKLSKFDRIHISQKNC